jgi:cystathionine beta-lyase/cystathionine gamma-synthase
MTPVYLTSTFVQSSPGEFKDGYDYARSKNPTRTVLEANLAALALWLQSRARNWERGIESLDLDRVFAGNLLPAPAKVA